MSGVIKVLHVLPYLESAGTERHVLALSQALKARGWPVGLLAPTGPLLDAFVAADISHMAFPRFGPRLGRTLRGIEAGVEWSLDWGADLIHVHAGVEVLYGVARALGRIAKRAQNPERVRRFAKVFTVHSYFGRLPAFDYALAARFGGRFADRVIAVSMADARMLERHGLDLGPSGKLRVVRNGMPDPGAFSWDELRALRRSLEKEFGFGGDVTLCLAVGRLTRQKGFDVLIDALASYQGPPVFVMIAGDGALRGALEEQARRLEVHAAAAPPAGEAAAARARVAFLGARNDVSKLLALADLFVLPSRMEGLSLALIEAHAAGTASIATDVGGNAEIVVDGETGKIVPSEDPHALGAALAELSGDRARRTAWGKAARERFEAHFTVERMAGETIRVYEEALHRAPA